MICGGCSSQSRHVGARRVILHFCAALTAPLPAVQTHTTYIHRTLSVPTISHPTMTGDDSGRPHLAFDCHATKVFCPHWYCNRGPCGRHPVYIWTSSGILPQPIPRYASLTLDLFLFLDLIWFSTEIHGSSVDYSRHRSM